MIVKTFTPLSLNQVIQYTLTYPLGGSLLVDNSSQFTIYIAIGAYADSQSIQSQADVIVAPYRSRSINLAITSNKPVLSIAVSDKPYSIAGTIGGSANTLKVSEASKQNFFNANGNVEGVIIGDLVIVAGGKIILSSTGIVIQADNLAHLEWRAADGTQTFYISSYDAGIVNGGRFTQNFFTANIGLAFAYSEIALQANASYASNTHYGMVDIQELNSPYNHVSLYQNDPGIGLTTFQVIPGYAEAFGIPNFSGFKIGYSGGGSGSGTYMLDVNGSGFFNGLLKAVNIQPTTNFISQVGLAGASGSIAIPSFTPGGNVGSIVFNSGLITSVNQST